MKTITYLFGVLLALNVHAAKIGDEATYKGTFLEAGVSKEIQFSKAITGFNSDTEQFVVKFTSQVAGAPAREQTLLNTDQELGDESMALQIIENCTQFSGEPESVTLASGAALATCKMTQKDPAGGEITRAVNVAAVPFMIAKMVEIDAGGLVTAEWMLVSYKKGQ